MKKRALKRKKISQKSENKLTKGEVGKKLWFYVKLLLALVIMLILVFYLYFGDSGVFRNNVRLSPIETMATQTISSCGTLNQVNAIYILQNDINYNVGGSDCFRIIAENITLDGGGHSIIGSNNAYSAVGIEANKTTIKNLISKSFYAGIHAGTDTKYNIILNSKFNYNNLGIAFLWSGSNNIINCSIGYNSIAGIRISSSDYNIIRDVDVRNNGIGLDLDSKYDNISGIFTGNSQIDIQCFRSNDINNNLGITYSSQFNCNSWILNLQNPTISINAPSNLVATALSDNSINLTWNDNSNNEDGFRINYKMNSNLTYSSLPNLVSGNNYNFLGLIPNTSYVFYVIGENNSYASANSNIATATTFVSGLTCAPNFVAFYTICNTSGLKTRYYLESGTSCGANPVALGYMNSTESCTYNLCIPNWTYAYTDCSSIGERTKYYLESGTSCGFNPNNYGHSNLTEFCTYTDNTPEYCTPNWEFSYTDCSSSSTKVGYYKEVGSSCNLNPSDFGLQNVTLSCSQNNNNQDCTPNWARSAGECLPSGKKTITYYQSGTNCPNAIAPNDVILDCDYVPQNITGIVNEKQSVSTFWIIIIILAIIVIIMVIVILFSFKKGKSSGQRSGQIGMTTTKPSSPGFKPAPQLQSIQRPVQRR